MGIHAVMNSLLAPLPEADAHSPSSRKDGLDHLAHFASQTEGASDLLSMVKLVADYMLKLPLNLTRATRETAQKFFDVVSSAGCALSIPFLVGSVNDLYKSVADWTKVSNLPHDEKVRKIGRATKDVFLEGANFVRSGTDVLDYLNSASVIQLGRQVTGLTVVNQVAAIVTDGHYLIENVYKRSHYEHEAAHTHNAQQIQQFGEKENLAWMKVAQYVGGVASAIITLIGLVLSSGVVATVFMSLGLAASTLYLTMKVSACFYEQIIEERQIAARLAI